MSRFAHHMKRITYISYFFLLLLLSLSSCGSVSSLLKKADKEYQDGNFYLAGNLYKKAYGRIPYKDREKRGKTAFRQGECYRKINYFRTEQVYKNAIRNKFNDSIVYLRLAQAQHKNGHYNEAQKNYEKYRLYAPQDSIAIYGLQGLELADSMSHTPTRYIVKKSKEFNAIRSSSFSPTFSSTSADGLIFTSNRKINKKEKRVKKNNVSGFANNHIFWSKKDNKEQWEKPSPIEGEIMSQNDEGITSITSDGRSMYFTRSLTEANKGIGTMILVSERAGGNWSTPKQLKLFNDSSISVAHPAISPDGNTLYFVSDAPDGVGGKDIWRAKKEKGEWRFVENLGTDINTTADEMFPTVGADGTLYYSSDGKPGLGGLDIFSAKAYIAPKTKKTRWKITNMGAPINSSKDDFGITLTNDGKNGFFSTNRQEHRNYDAIWSFWLPTISYLLEGKITDNNGNNIPEGIITLISDKGGNIRVHCKGDGTFRIKLERNNQYAILASARGFLNHKDSLSTHHFNEDRSESINKNFALNPLFRPVRLDNIYYDFDKSTLREDSKEGLQTLLKILTDNPHVTIEMGSHTDYKGDFEYNRLLSFRRATSVVDFLIKNGINAKRLTAVGYGEGKPTEVDKTQHKKHSFLPIGQLLTENYIATLTAEQQEIANQINRRTEFKVTSTTYQLY